MKILKLLSKVYICGLIGLTIAVIILYAYTAFYARPTGDDLGYSASTHRVWNETHSVSEVVSEAVDVTIRTYNGEDASFVMTFLTALIPEVFKPWTFWIAIWGILFVIVWAVYITGNGILHKGFGLPASIAVTGASTFMFLYLQHMPSTKSGMYWFTGSVHYVMPFAMVLITVTYVFRYFISKLSDDCSVHNKSNSRFGNILILLIASILIGGSGYFAAMYVILFYILTFLMILIKRVSVKKIWPLVIPFLVVVMEFIIVLKSPGMSSFRGGGNMEFSIGLAIETVVESLRRSFTYIMEWCSDCVFIIPCFILLAFIIWGGSIDWKKVPFDFKHPIIFSFFIYALYAAVYSPWVYSEQFDTLGASAGPVNFCFMTFLYSTIAIIAYVTGYFKKRAGRINAEGIGTGSIDTERRDTGSMHSHTGERLKLMVWAGLILGSLIFMFINRSNVKVTNGYVGLTYITSGQAADYKKQCETNMEMLLDDSIRDVKLCPTNADQGLLCNMVATENPDDFTSYAYREFYGKDSVVMIME